MLHHLRIILRDVTPTVGREFLVPSDLRLDRLHDVIQIVMGWTNAHMHEFVAGGSLRNGVRYGPSGHDPDGFSDAPEDERKATLKQLAGAKGAKFIYSYDFGDDWIHDVTVKAVGAASSVDSGPFCLKATGACPPEDCGGPFGYANLIQILKNPEDEEYQDMREWIGGDWDADHYDIAAVNTELAALAARWSKKPAAKKSSATKSKKG